MVASTHPDRRDLPATRDADQNSRHTMGTNRCTTTPRTRRTQRQTTTRDPPRTTHRTMPKHNTHHRNPNSNRSRHRRSTTPAIPLRRTRHRTRDTMDQKPTMAATQLDTSQTQHRAVLDGNGLDVFSDYTAPIAGRGRSPDALCNVTVRSMACLGIGCDLHWHAPQLTTHRPPPALTTVQL